MTDLEQEILRQLHELSKEVAALRERVAVLEAHRYHDNRTAPVHWPATVLPHPVEGWKLK